MKVKKDKNYISVYVRHAEDGPSAYYRVMQYLRQMPELNMKINNAVSQKQFRRGIDIKSAKLRFLYKVYLYIVMSFRAVGFLIYDIINKPKKVIISRTVIPRKTNFIIYYLLKKVVSNSVVLWDFDDAIDLGEIDQKQWQLLCKYSKKIIVTNEYLRERLPKECREKTILLPTTDGDMERFDQKEMNRSRLGEYEKEINILWLATAEGLLFLERILPAIDSCAKRLQEKNKILNLMVVCNRPVSKETKYLNVQNIKWTREKAIELLKKAHIGIMPLIDSEFVRGKGGFKLVQYMASGIPVVASDIGYNHSVVQQGGILVDDKISIDSWEEAIYKLASDKTCWDEMSKEAYLYWEKEFSFASNLECWKELCFEEY